MVLRPATVTGIIQPYQLTVHGDTDGHVSAHPGPAASPAVSTTADADTLIEFGADTLPGDQARPPESGT